MIDLLGMLEMLELIYMISKRQIASTGIGHVKKDIDGFNQINQNSQSGLFKIIPDFDQL